MAYHSKKWIAGVRVAQNIQTIVLKHTKKF